MENKDSSTYTNCIFEQPWWLNTVAEGKSIELLVKDKEKTVARWVIVKNKRKIIMPQHTQTLGFWIDDDILRADTYFNKQKEIILNLINQIPAKHIKVALDPQNQYFLPFIWRGFNIKPCISYRINDLSNTENIYNNFSKIVKKNIHAAQNKVSIKEIDDILPLYELLKKTFQLQKRKAPFSEKVLKKLYKACKDHNSCKLLYAIDKENNIHSGTLFVYDEKTCYYLISGSDPKYRNSGANTLLIWEGIKHAANTSKTFDFEGSMIEGIENFVRQFGGTPTVFYEIRKSNLISDFFEISKYKIKRIIGYKQ